jgi:hypothetical protein
MAIIKLPQVSLVVTRANGLNTPTWTEVGFIPNDEFGCKIYARNEDGRVDMIGLHSKTYGCNRSADGVEIVPAPVKRDLVLWAPAKRD